MSKFLELNLVEYSLSQDYVKIVFSGAHICLCCLGESGPLVRLGSCGHTDFLVNLCNAMPELTENMNVCLVCHEMLAKIDLFRTQVKESLHKLTIQGKKLTQIKKLHNLTNFTSLPLSIPQLLPKESEQPIKTEDESSPIEFDMETEVKVEEDYQLEEEKDISDEDTSIPLSEVKKELTRKRKNHKTDSVKKNKKVKKSSNYCTRTVFEEKYKGKIEQITLSYEDVLAERESDKLKDTYMKLPYKCEYCIRGFDHAATLTSHTQQYHTFRKGSMRCELCNSYLSSEASFKEHNRRHYKRYECVICRKRNNTLSAVIGHYNDCHNDSGDIIATEYTCQECGITLKSNRAYRYHLEKHRGKEQCNECGKTFVNKNGLNNHMLTVHKKSSRVYSCEPCEKVYKAKSGLLAHVNSHHTTSKAYCDICRTHYNSTSILRQHLKMHSRHAKDCDKKFVCSECGEKYLTRSALTQHINWTHLKKALHTCTLCSKVFKNNSALRKHTSFVHEHKRPPRNKICDYCGRGFTTLQILRSHVRTHTGERPLQCPHCDATFAHSAALYTHNKLHKGTKLKTTES